MGAPPSNRLFIGDLPLNLDETTLREVFGAYGTISSCKLLPPRPGAAKVASIIEFATLTEAQWIVDNLNGNMPEGMAQPVCVKFAKPTGGAGAAGGYGKADGKSWNYGKNVSSPYDGRGAVKYNGKAAGTYDAKGAGTNDGKGAGKKDVKGAGKYDGKGAVTRDGRGAAGYNGKGSGTHDGMGATTSGGKATGETSAVAGAGTTMQGILDVAVKNGLFPCGTTRPDEQCVYIRGLPSDTTDLDLYKMFSVFGAIPPRGVKAMTKEDGSCNSIGFVDFLHPDMAKAAIAALNGFVLPDGTSLFLKTKSPKKGTGKGKGKWKDTGEGKWSA